jgi:predicted ester cyclase
MPRDEAERVTFTSTESNKAIARRFFLEVVAQGNLTLADELFAASFTINGQAGTPEGIKQWVAGVRAAFPDVEVVVEEQVAEGDRVATRRTFRGTHLGEFVTPFGRIPPTGKRIEWRQLSIVRIVNDQVIEDSVILDDVGLLHQLGATLTVRI